MIRIKVSGSGFMGFPLLFPFSFPVGIGNKFYGDFTYSQVGDAAVMNIVKSGPDEFF